MTYRQSGRQTFRHTQTDRQTYRSCDVEINAIETRLECFGNIDYLWCLHK